MAKNKTKSIQKSRKASKARRKPAAKPKKKGAATKKKTKARRFVLAGQRKASLQEVGLNQDNPKTIFYRSLFRERPQSEMAQTWLVQHGMLDSAEALRICRALGLRE